jgi:hypothetical protein
MTMPVITRSTWSMTDMTTLQLNLAVNGQVYSRATADDLTTAPRFGQGRLSVPVPENSTTGTQFRLTLLERLVAFSSVIDDEEAAKIPWPQDWPAHTTDALKPQWGIESDDPLFLRNVAIATDDSWRLYSPYIVAKRLVQYACQNVSAGRDVMLLGTGNVTRGLRISGALAAAQAGDGSDVDLTCVCVALLRAAGIPARPVIGMENTDRDGRQLVPWGEFYLPNAGWVPFDPKSMQRRGVRSWDLDDPWQDFGTMKDLNRRLPLSYTFLPSDPMLAYDAPALWGWTRLAPDEPFPLPIGTFNVYLPDGSTNVYMGGTYSSVSLMTTNRGQYRPE